MPAHPNVLIVYADQWRAQSLGYMGCKDVQTPNLDRLAAESVNCQCAVSGCPVSTPARASLLTGLYPHKHGLFLNDVPLNPELPTLAKTFAAAGYRTALVGKWHMDGHGRYAYIPRERRQGFEYFKGLECSHNYNHSRYYDNEDPTLRFWPGYDAFAQTDDMINWIKRKDDRPFLGLLAWGPPHSPLDTAPPEYQALYRDRDIALPANVPQGDWVPGVITGLKGYYAHCTALDHCVGRIVAALEEQGLADNTLLLFLSDHGEFLGAHRLFDKQGPWDEAVRVPFLLRMPPRIGLRTGATELVIDHPDIFPTLCGLLGLAPPVGVQGRNLAEHLRAGTVPQDNYALIAAYHNFGNWPGIGSYAQPLYHAREFRGLRTPHYTYVEEHKGPWLLYDNHADPLQMTNLIAPPDAPDAPAHRPLREQLAADLRRKLAQVDDKFENGWDMVKQWGYTVNENGTAPIRDWNDG